MNIEEMKDILIFLLRLMGVLLVIWILTWGLVPLLIILFCIFSSLAISIARLSVKIILGILLLGWLLHFFISPKISNYIEENKLADAIYLAEGGKKAQYPYGITSIVCSSDKECRRICINTIRNNKVRYNNYGYLHYSTYLEFLASRYCPVGVENDKKDLNKNWLKNVKYFLEKGRK